MKIERLLKLLFYLLNNKRVKINDLSNYLGVSRRTIFRDLDTLTLAGFPIVTHQGHAGGVELMEEYKFDKSILSETDISNILIALKSLKNLGDNQKLDYLINKIVPKNHESSVYDSDIYVDLSSWFDKDDSQELLLDIRQAIKDNSFIQIDYHSASLYSQRIIEPYKLIFKYDDWYLLAYCMKRSAFRVFKLNRISDYSILQKHFIPKTITEKEVNISLPKRKFSPNTDSQKYTVILEFDLKDKEFIIRILGAKNISEKGKKGIITFETYSLDWTEHNIISLEDKVKIIEPIKLKQRVIQKIKKMAQIYQK